MLAEMARLITIDEGSSQAFKVRAYENAIHGIEGYSGNVADLDHKGMESIGRYRSSKSCEGNIRSSSSSC
jgi:hypothetical protein